MIKVVIFDADGMLLEQERPSSFLSRDYGINIDNLNTFFDGPFQKCLIGKADLKEEILPYLNIWGWNKGLKAFLDLWFTREHKVNQAWNDYIKELRDQNILCFLATNQEKYRLKYMLDELGFGKLFDKVYSSAFVGHKKPSYKFFSKVFEDLKNIKKEEILFWDDRPKNIEGVKSLGINAELFTSFENFKEKMKKYI